MYPILSRLMTRILVIYTTTYSKKLKLDHHSANIIVVEYTSTISDVYYINDTTESVKTGAYALFNESHFTSPITKTPLVLAPNKINQ